MHIIANFMYCVSNPPTFLQPAPTAEERKKRRLGPQLKPPFQARRWRGLSAMHREWRCRFCYGISDSIYFSPGAEEKGETVGVLSERDESSEGIFVFYSPPKPWALLPIRLVDTARDVNEMQRGIRLGSHFMCMSVCTSAALFGLYWGFTIHRASLSHLLSFV